MEASQTEILLAKYVAPALLSPIGKSIIAAVYIIWSILSAYAWTKVEVDFNMDTYLVHDDELLVASYSEAK